MMVSMSDGEYIKRGILGLRLAGRGSVGRSKRRFMDEVKVDEKLVVREDDQRGGLDGGR